jgi:hypothetical protein
VHNVRLRVTLYHNNNNNIRARRDRTGKSIAISPFSGRLIKTIRHLCTHYVHVAVCMYVCACVGVYFNDAGESVTLEPFRRDDCRTSRGLTRSFFPNAPCVQTEIVYFCLKTQSA